ncbi:hypothetical protein GCM10028789_28160 [Sinomonas halotolerans]
MTRRQSARRPRGVHGLRLEKGYKLWGTDMSRFEALAERSAATPAKTLRCLTVDDGGMPAPGRPPSSSAGMAGPGLSPPIRQAPASRRPRAWPRRRLPSR